MTRQHEVIRRLCQEAAQEKMNSGEGTDIKWYDCALEVLTDTESKEVDDMWRDMANTSEWIHAFFLWMHMKGTNERKEKEKKRYAKSDREL